MRNRIILLMVVFVAALRAEGAMVRVVGVEDARTLVVERNGTRERVTLAGIAIIDETQARTMLEWTLASAWLSLESTEGGVLAYRSPDALFVNRELVTRGFARATLPGIEPTSHVTVTYLGTLHLQESRAAKATSRTAPASETRTATRSRPPASPSPRRRRRS
jgi:hypothetical protein